jgi:hypothetical protein
VKQQVMLKVLSMVAAVAVLSFSPAYAASDECTDARMLSATDAHMKKMNQMIAEVTDAAKEREATMHLDMSKAEMKKGNTAGCMEHMEETHKAMGL